MRAALACLVLAACTAPATEETEVAGDTAADAADPSVRAGDTTLSVSRDVARRGDTFVLRGKTSRNITGGNAFVNDDPYGAFSQVSPRVFEVAWQADEVRSLADGVDQFVALDFGARHLAAHVVVRPRVGALIGSSKIYMTAELTPVVVDGLVYYRLAGHTTEGNSAVQFRVGDVEERGVVTRLDDKAFVIDLPAQRAIELTAGQDLDVLAFFQSGGVQKHMTLGLSIKKLGMTTGDAYETWPRPTCGTALKTCLGALAGDGGDTGACGDAVASAASGRRRPACPALRGRSHE